MKTLLLAALTLMVCVPAPAQEYPAKPVRFVTSVTGGGGDFVARVLGQAVSGQLGQPVVVDNRANIIGIEHVAQSRPDGYTLLVTSNVFWLTPLMQKVSYEPLRDFSSIALIATSPNVVLAHPSLPVKSVRELIVLVRSRPGQLNFAAGSKGSASHLAAEMFRVMAKLDMVFVPYKGAGPALNDTIAGHVQLLFSNLAAARPHLKTARLRALAITSAQPSALAPELGTVAGQGLPGYESEAIYGIFGPSGTPAAIAQRLNQEVIRALQRGEVRERFAGAGLQIVAGSGPDLAARVATEMKRMGKVIAEAGIRLE